MRLFETIIYVVKMKIRRLVGKNFLKHVLPFLPVSEDLVL